MIDLTGAKYNRLTVLSLNRVDKSTKRYRYYWNCMCDCGKDTIVRSDMLKNGSVSSCGCRKVEYSQQLGKNASLPDGIAGSNNLYCTYKNGAKRRNHVFEFTKEEFRAFVVRPCHYCGSVNHSCLNVNHYRSKFYYTGIDRVDNARGYTIDNCVPCCKLCNQAKMTLGYNEFLDLIARIYHNRVVTERGHEATI